MFITAHLRDATQINKVVNASKPYLTNDLLKFDANPELFGCNNGIYDFTQEIFRPPKFDDYVTYSCGHNFTPLGVGMKYMNDEGIVMEVEEGDISEEEVQDFEDIDQIFREVFPDEKVRKLMFYILSSGLVGYAIEKFFVFNGCGRNGKGVINEFMQWILGDYFAYASPTILTENPRNKSSGGANPAIAELNK